MLLVSGYIWTEGGCVLQNIVSGHMIYQAEQAHDTQAEDLTEKQKAR